MNSNKDVDIGTQLGDRATTHIISRADEFREAHAEFMTVTNESPIVGLKAQLASLEGQRRALNDRLHALPPMGDLRARRRRSRYFWAITTILTVAGFFLALLAFDPYQLGWKAYLYCIGIAIVTPVATDFVLEQWASPRLMKSLALAAGLSGLTALVLLALVRGDIFATHVQSSNPAVIVDDGSAPTSPAPNDFYANTVGRLRLLMALLALSMELAAGLSLHDARRYGLETTEHPETLRKVLAGIEAQMVWAVSEIRRLESEPAAFEAKFKADFAKALLNGAKREATKYLPVALLALAASSPGFAADRNSLSERMVAHQVHQVVTDRALRHSPIMQNIGRDETQLVSHCAVVVALDLTRSAAARDTNAETEFAKNGTAVGRLLAQVPTGCAVTVLGITDRSFAQPAVLLSARVDANAGYFQERLFTARQSLVRAWTARLASLAPHATQTDLFGALLVASERLNQLPATRRVLVIFSDMRHDTAALTLEPHRLLPTAALLATVKRQRLLADLHGVQVSVLGADAAGRTIGEWRAVRDFWAGYCWRRPEIGPLGRWPVGPRRRLASAVGPGLSPLI